MNKGTEKAVRTVCFPFLCGISHVGARENNEDSFLVLKLADAYLLAVADGLGGHNAGEVASGMAVKTLGEVFLEEYGAGLQVYLVRLLLKKAHELAHSGIKEAARGEREGMGTTLVSAFVRGGRAIIANTGDSRAYLIRNGKVVARTRDHSLVQELLDKGEITAEGARRHPMRNIITKALGINFGVDLYEWELKQGDVLLLSSDGLHDYIDERRIADIASSGRTPEEIARKLVEEALPVTRDNVTVVVWR
ncbi:protein phosphatase 2C domain-containing protein [Thermococcus sp.]|uniref:PP2C family protein-serine/threonine phosphatase n=1 Tax=Thermococcus sp. TaxID=35749 RepID=UPI00260B390E|nr:protein phosphatase 2C domain-containing protein [Thermococcus sp.]